METVFGVYLELAELEGSTGALRGWHRYLALNYRGPVHPSPMVVTLNEIVFELEFGDGLNLKPVRKQQQTTQNAKTFSGLLGFHVFFFILTDSVFLWMFSMSCTWATQRILASMEGAGMRDPFLSAFSILWAFY